MKKYKSYCILILISISFFYLINFINNKTSNITNVQEVQEQVNNSSNQNPVNSQKNEQNNIKPNNEVQVQDLQEQSQQQSKLKKNILDYGYKKNIIDASGNSNLNIENLDSIMGPSQISEFITRNMGNVLIYKPSSDKFQANFHIHTTASDGSMTPIGLLEKAVSHATKINKTVFIAVTDHNTLEGAKKIVEIINNNPSRYEKIKVILGIEVYSTYNNLDTYKPVDIHMLCLGVNPFDKEMNTVFYKKNPNDKWNYSNRTFVSAVNLLKRKGIVGIAHPARYVESSNMKTSEPDYYSNLFKTFKYLCNGSTFFTEGYYQSYSTDTEKKNNVIANTYATQYGILKTGSTDSHGESILEK